MYLPQKAPQETNAAWEQQASAPRILTYLGPPGSALTWFPQSRPWPHPALRLPAPLVPVIPRTLDHWSPTSTSHLARTQPQPYRWCFIGSGRTQGPQGTASVVLTHLKLSGPSLAFGCPLAQHWAPRKPPPFWPAWSGLERVLVHMKNWRLQYYNST